jgi:formylglycine-generating enzyme required for sulfatase activity
MRIGLTLAFVAVFGVSGASAIEIETVPIGNANNPVDETIMSDGSTGYGSVPYNYRISTYEVTNAEYVEFLNAVAATDTHALYNTKMGSNARGGIIQSGESGSYTYSLKANMANKPVNWIEPRDAFRFANWLHNGQPTGAQDHSTTEDGAYFMDHAELAPIEIKRKEGAKWFLPSEDEWTKAAYYDPRTESRGGPPGDDFYWDFATGSDELPILAESDEFGDVVNPGSNVANYGNGAVWNVKIGNITTVGGAGPSSVSFYGTYDQNGNVWEWTEAVVKVREGRAHFGVRGGCYDDAFFMLKSNRRPSGRDSIDNLYSGSHGLRLATLFSPIDLDGNERVNAADIDLLSDQVSARTLNTAYDLDGNGMVDEDDRSVWVEDLVGTYFGDSNLDGRFDSSDLVDVLEAGHYEDSLLLNSGWSTGDWDGNREFTSRDFVFVLQKGGYEAGQRAAAPIPEPSAACIMGLGWTLLVLWRRRSK